MVEPDPWNEIDKNQENTHNCVPSNLSNETNANPSAFEDNFIAENASYNFPDSKEYIQSLGIYQTEYMRFLFRFVCVFVNKAL